MGPVVIAGVVVVAATSTQSRADRAGAVATARLAEWLGPTSSPLPVPVPRGRVFDAASSMRIESEVAFALAGARLRAISDPLIRDAFAWHLQARIVEELFDLEYQQPGHHAAELRVFGDHVVWGFPTLVLSRQARDERPSRRLAHAADAVATLENMVGWPALANALRVVAAAPASIDAGATQALLESALGVPADWFFAALAEGVHINYALDTVESREGRCDAGPCYTTTVAVARHGAALWPDASSSGELRIAIDVDFGAGAPMRLKWDGRAAAAQFQIESRVPPATVRLDPGRRLRLDEDWHDQQWRAGRAPAPVPVKSIAAWLVWLQNASLTYGLLL